jgi:hypothetical protein
MRSHVSVKGRTVSFKLLLFCPWGNSVLVHAKEGRLGALFEVDVVEKKATLFVSRVEPRFRGRPAFCQSMQRPKKTSGSNTMKNKHKRCASIHVFIRPTNKLSLLCCKFS